MCIFFFSDDNDDDNGVMVLKFFSPTQKHQIKFAVIKHVVVVELVCVFIQSRPIKFVSLSFCYSTTTKS